MQFYTDKYSFNQNLIAQDLIYFTETVQGRSQGDRIFSLGLLCSSSAFRYSMSSLGETGRSVRPGVDIVRRPTPRFSCKFW